MSLATLPKVQKLQDALHAKAKGSPKFRFYALYDKVYRDDVLWTAHRRCLVNGGAAGVDGQTFEDIEQYGVTKWLGGAPTRSVGRRRNLERRRIVLVRCGGPTFGRCPIFPNRTASRDRWVFRRSRIAWCRRRRCWSWSRSSRLTCNRSNTPTGLDAAHWTRFAKSTRC